MVGGAGSVGVSGYIYAGNGPAGATDPSGMCNVDGAPTDPDRCTAPDAITGGGSGGGSGGGANTDTDDNGDTGGNTLNPDWKKDLDELNAQKAAAQTSLNEAESFTKQVADELIHLVMDVIGITDAIACVRERRRGRVHLDCAQRRPVGQVVQGGQGCDQGDRHRPSPH